MLCAGIQQSVFSQDQNDAASVSPAPTAAIGTTAAPPASASSPPPGTATATAADTDAPVDIRASERGLFFEGAEDAPAATPSGFSSAFAIFRILVVLLLVAAAIYGLLYMLKRSKNPTLAEDPFLKVLARAPINAKTAAAVVSVGEKAWLVGLSDTSVSLVAELTDQETIDAMRLAASQRAASPGAKIITFKDMLAKLAGVMAPNAAGHDAGAGSVAESLRKKRDKLRGL